LRSIVAKYQRQCQVIFKNGAYIWISRYD